MRTHKVRVRLTPGVPVCFRHAALQKDPDPKCSIELVSFEATQTRFAWVIRQGNGELVSGVASYRGESALSLWPDSWVALRIPISIDHLPGGIYAPHFLVQIPEAFVPVFNKGAN